MRTLLAAGLLLAAPAADAQFELKKTAKPEIYSLLQEHKLLGEAAGVKAAAFLYTTKLSGAAAPADKPASTAMRAYEYRAADGLVASVEPLLKDNKVIGVRSMSITAARGLIAIYSFDQSTTTETAELHINHLSDFPLKAGSILHYRQLHISGSRDSSVRNLFRFTETICAGLPPVDAAPYPGANLGKATPINCTVRALDAKKAIEQHVYELDTRHPDPETLEFFLYFPSLDWAYLRRVSGKTINMDVRLLHVGRAQ